MIRDSEFSTAAPVETGKGEFEDFQCDRHLICSVHKHIHQCIQTRIIGLVLVDLVDWRVSRLP
jgi:hypothetical protein